MRNLFLTFCLIIISGCSFKPINYSIDDNEYEGYDQALASVQLANIDSKYNYYLRNSLLKQFNPQNQDLNKQYKLSAKVNSNIENLLVQHDSTVTQKEIRFITNYTISKIKNGKIISEGTFPILISYSETSSIYSTYVNEEYNYKNGLKEIARELRLRSLLAISQDQTYENSAKKH
jgi:hypothetical protein